jgi:hypothetical protein
MVFSPDTRIKALSFQRYKNSKAKDESHGSQAI